MARFQPQRLVRRAMPAARGRPIVVALQDKRSEEALDLYRLPLLEVLSGPGPVGGVDAVGNRLEHHGDHPRTRLIERSANEPFDVQDRRGVLLTREEPVDQPLEFHVSRGEEGVTEGVGRFF